MKLSELPLRDYIAIEVLPTCLTFDYGNDWGKAGKDHGPRAVRKAFSIADDFLAFVATREKSHD